MSKAPDAYLSYLHHHSWAVACDHITSTRLTGILRRPAHSDDHILRIIRVADAAMLSIASVYDTTTDSRQKPLWSIVAVGGNSHQDTAIELPQMPYQTDVFDLAHTQLREAIDLFAQELSDRFASGTTRSVE